LQRQKIKVKSKKIKEAVNYRIIALAQYQIALAKTKDKSKKIEVTDN
jgi:hypothetical protein